MRFLVLLYLVFIGITTGHKPSDFNQILDVKQPVTDSQLNCLKDLYISTFLIRAYLSNNYVGMFDYNSCGTYQAVRRNFPNDVLSSIYMEPSPTGDKSAKHQMNELYSAMTDTTCYPTIPPILFLMVIPSHRWNKHVPKNIKFISDILETAHSLNVTVGIFTNADDWQEITHNVDHKEAFKTSLLLWWEKDKKIPDDTQTEDKFKPFGGWTVNDIFATQYAVQSSVCKISCGRDFN